MRRRCKFLYLFFHVMLCCVFAATAQGVNEDSVGYSDEDTATYSEAGETPAPKRTIVYNTATPDARQWDQATGSNAYGYRDKREYLKKAKPAEEIPGWYKFLVRLVDFLSSTPGKTILWIALALIIGYVAYRIVTGQGGGLFGRRDRKEHAQDDTGNVTEQGLLESDWEERLRTALAAGDSRLAVRFSYMHLLQVLQERGLIAYRPDKTNTEYYRELTETLRQPFRTVSRQYEYAWYGNFLPEPAAMESYMQTYYGLKKSIVNA